MLRGLTAGATATVIGGTASASDRGVVEESIDPDDVSVTITGSTGCSDGVDPSNWSDGTGTDGGENFDRVDLDDDVEGVSGKDSYEDFTCEGYTVVVPGNSFDVSIDWNDGGFDHHYANVWIDWKQTNDWSEAYETRLMADESDDSDTVTGTVDVPDVAADGLTLARVRLSMYDYKDPDVKAIGEVNDFTVNIWASRECADPSNWPSGAGDYGYENIDRVSIGSQVEKTSDRDGYEDFTCPDKAIFEPGDTFDVEMDWSDGGLDNHYANLYVDWDQNQDWSTATEYVLLDDADDDSVTGSTTVTVPDDAASGPTLARARLSWGQFDEPDADGLGEVNDFTIYVE
ncbi:hypothetical protein BRC81_01620 [Halobacteriales archaeon QS_1_68_20]|nr:MAG: hypothetical protein BRC81_01620 [Halobacteriales archaeon QS_1_68_20]